jgi:hypothetical protein
MKPADEAKIKRTATNVAKLLGNMLKLSSELERRSRKARLRINSDLKALTESMRPEDRGLLITAVAVQVQEIFDAAGSPKVAISGGCAGAQGVGIRATDNGNYAGVCVTGSLDEGITGGGVEGGFTY